MTFPFDEPFERDLLNYQKDQWLWTVYNFQAEPGWVEALAPLAGATEEFGELIEARLADDVLEQQDAVGDMAVYLTDVCNRIGLRMLDLRFSQRKPYPPRNFVMAMAMSLGKLNHAILKQSQNIRMNEDHMLSTTRHMSACFDHLEFYCVENWQMSLFDDIVYPTWEKVRQRDWTKERAAHS